MNKRIRKKKHLGEFTEWGFTISFSTEIDLWDRLIDMIESNDLSIGGGGSLPNYFCFIVEHNKHKMTDQHRQIVRTWLEENNCTNINIGDLIDLWHAKF